MYSLLMYAGGIAFFMGGHECNPNLSRGKKRALLAALWTPGQ